MKRGLKMNEFIITITVKEEVIRERLATKEEVLLCKKAILKDRIDKMMEEVELKEVGDKLQKLLMEEISNEIICEKMEKMIFNEIDFIVQDEVSSVVMEVRVTIVEGMWD